MADLDLVRSGDLALRSGGPVARNVVFREDVFELLDRGREFPVSLVCAPAGYGKSLAVASWLQARGLAATWVALAPRMVSAATAWDAIAAALEHDHQGTVVAAEFAALAHRAPDELPAALARPGWPDCPSRRWWCSTTCTWSTPPGCKSSCSN